MEEEEQEGEEVEKQELELVPSEESVTNSNYSYLLTFASSY